MGGRVCLISPEKAGGAEIPFLLLPGEKTTIAFGDPEGRIFLQAAPNGSGSGSFPRF